MSEDKMEIEEERKEKRGEEKEEEKAKEKADKAEKAKKVEKAEKEEGKNVENRKEPPSTSQNFPTEKLDKCAEFETDDEHLENRRFDSANRLYFTDVDERRKRQFDKEEKRD
ncbi:ribosomal biogenesis protein LAS1L-like [Osmia bicornis bicornis]|uniref:ribosomal biogenesis protein LAS1L-like n=1 Tax=Osmia bicornis bicornis TaxID=1437191 RepID=UPI001EAF340D|nr:ribosomal biogenesis protein LAS1L-like [Osmia bicornis bicornis]